MIVAYLYLHRQEFGLVLPQPLIGADSAGSDAALSSEPAHITWQTVNRTDDGFRVDMPIDVKYVQVPDTNESGGTEQVNMIIAYPNSETTFSVAWADNPPVYRVTGRSPDRELDMARDGTLARTQTSLMTESRDPAGGLPAREIVARNGGGGMMDARLIFAGERLYMLTCAFPSANARREQDVTRFFNSFKTSQTSRIPETLPLAPAPFRRN